MSISVVSQRLPLLALCAVGCVVSATPSVPDAAVDVATEQPPPPRPCAEGGAVDLLVEIDNTGSMRDNEMQLAAQFSVLIERLRSGSNGVLGGRMRDLHVGVISTDLGTPGSTVPSCVNSGLGDDGLLNPVRQGQATRGHQPWTTVQRELFPPLCNMDPLQFPTFLSYSASDDPTFVSDAFVCLIPFAGGGCGLEQQLESIYRALVTHDASDREGNTDANAGFLRAEAVLAILVLSDEEDGSTRDCRYAERDAMGRPRRCTDATAVFDSTSADWASSDLNLRFYMYQPGSAQDPTWPLDRYFDPNNLARGLLSSKPGHPDWIVFGAITGIPLKPPQRADETVDWDALLGRAPDGSDGYVGMSREGPVSMRQRTMDPDCTTRVVPACRREGSTYDPAHPACDTNAQYFSWPSRRIATIVRRFDEVYGNGSISSTCRSTYAPALIEFADHVRRRICP